MTAAGVAVAVFAGAIAVLATLPAGLDAAGLAAVGLALLAFGVASRSRATITWGGVLAYLGVLVGGVGGLDPGLFLVGTVGTVVAWDAGTHVAELELQLDPAAGTDRATLVHVSATALVASVVAGLAYLAFLAGNGRFPPLAGLLLVVGAVLVALVLEPRGT